ncbi:MAG: DUF3987 domain-containing protein [Acidithiobacillus ferrooxidans]|nr:DUF3987 domain-containing protein [Acidithiobacillus ferrooxidans]MDD5002917.1 DUF3987 domain-containing protein [Acidithiobacillus sp.]MDD5378704.1 DUF3987 domain-containing protein [Acidithiobacillus sp.]MDD5575946.1 DUF3987 domain-containing protein [Acidithiobacillus sp.]
MKDNEELFEIPKAQNYTGITVEENTSNVVPPFKQELMGTRFTFTDLEKNPGPVPFPILGMTPVFASCIRHISGTSGISDGMVVGPFLTCLSAIIMPQTTITSFYHKIIGVNIYCQTNVASSSRKTDMFNPLLNLLNDHDSNRRDHIKELNRHQVAKIKAWKLKIDALKKQHAKASQKSNDDDAMFFEEEYKQVLLEEPALLPEMRITMSDATPAAVILGLSENGGSITFFIDEGVLLYQKIVNNEIHHINSAWSGAIVDKTTIRGGNIYIKNPRLSSHTFIQPDIFNQISRGKSFSFLKATGYFTRVLICAPSFDKKTNEFSDYKGSEHDLKKLLSNLKDQLSISYPLDGLFSGCNRKLTLSQESEMLLQSFNDAVQEQVKPGGVFHEMPEFCGKIAEHIYRISALLHYIEQCNSDEVAFSTVSAAIVLVDWYANEHWRLIAKGGKPLNVEVGAEKLLHFLRFRHDRSSVQRITFNDLRHRVECFHDDPDFLDDCVNYLQQRGDIVVTGHRRKGRQGGYRRYEINFSSSFIKGERWQPKA